MRVFGVACTFAAVCICVHAPVLTARIQASCVRVYRPDRARLHLAAALVCKLVFRPVLVTSSSACDS